MIKKIEAAVLEEINEPLKLKVLRHNKLKQGQVLVKILYSGVCRSQLMEIKGKRGKDKWLPHCLGHEASGKVIAVGKSVKKCKVRDEVILSWIKGKGIDADTAKYLGDNCTVNSGKVTTFSNYAVVSENRVFLKPKNLNFKEAVLYGCAIPTGFGMVLNEIKPKKKDNILLFGLGGVGLSSLIALKCLGVKNIAVIDIDKNKLKIAKKLGASHTIKFCKDIEAKIRKFSEEIDVCIECTGKVEIIELGFSSIKYNGGRIYFASHPPNDKKISIFPHDLIRGKRIYGSWGGSSALDKDIKKIHNMIRKKKINIKELVNKEYNLNDINKAIKDLEAGRVLRPIIKMNHL